MFDIEHQSKGCFHVLNEAKILVVLCGRNVPRAKIYTRENRVENQAKI